MVIKGIIGKKKKDHRDLTISNDEGNDNCDDVSIRVGQQFQPRVILPSRLHMAISGVDSFGCHS